MLCFRILAVYYCHVCALIIFYVNVEGTLRTETSVALQTVRAKILWVY